MRQPERKPKKEQWRVRGNNESNRKRKQWNEESAPVSAGAPVPAGTARLIKARNYEDEERKRCSCGRLA